MCIISTGYKIYTRGKYEDFFYFIEKQNYTNYEPILMDDMSPDNSAENYYEYLKPLNYRLKNRIKIVRSDVHVGSLGNMIFAIKKYCAQDSIVVIVDTDDSLIGNQVLNVVNAVYQDSNTWFAYARYLLQKTKQDVPGIPISKPLYFPVQEYREKNKWVTSHLRTFRTSLFDRVPL